MKIKYLLNRVDLYGKKYGNNVSIKDEEPHEDKYLKLLVNVILSAYEDWQVKDSE